MKLILYVFAGLMALLLLFGREFMYVVSETDQVILLQFGEPIGDPVITPGLHFKMPFIQTPARMEKRILGWDGPTTEMPTNDKLYILVDCFARWRIQDPLRYLQRLRDERTAQSRLDDILGGETRNVVARHNLIEVVRTTINRRPEAAALPAASTEAVEDMESIVEPSALGDDMPQFGGWQPITVGRSALEREIFNMAATRLPELGIELLDFRFKRINYNDRVSEKIYERMISERNQIAEQFRSEGAGEAAKIGGEREKLLLDIESEAYREVQTIRGVADATAAEIYSSAYNGDAVSREFYDFMKTLEAYEKVITEKTSMVLSTDSHLLRFLRGLDPVSPAALAGSRGTGEPNPVVAPDSP